MCVAVFFFFSSRRRHTRYWRDWSSDVCSSDLQRPSWLRGFFGAVAGRGRASGKNYQAVAGIGSGKLYAEQVFEALQRGVPEEKLKSGERLSLEARSLTDRIGAP